MRKYDSTIRNTSKSSYNYIGQLKGLVQNEDNGYVRHPERTHTGGRLGTQSYNYVGQLKQNGVIRHPEFSNRRFGGRTSAYNYIRNLKDMVECQD